jgi:hypothetical protein
MPDEVDRQDWDTLLWLLLSMNEEEPKQDTNAPIMGLL